MICIKQLIDKTNRMMAIAHLQILIKLEHIFLSYLNNSRRPNALSSCTGEINLYEHGDLHRKIRMIYSGVSKSRYIDIC
jgi:hypothetical protein